MTTAMTGQPIPLAASRARQGGGFVGLAWLTWRQHRWMIVAGVLGFGLVTAHLWWLDHEVGRLAALCGGLCKPQSTPQELFTVMSSANTGLDALMGAGPVVAAFLAAPLVSREYEQRTNLLVWSQDVRAVHWLDVKGALLAAVAAVLSAVLGFVASGLAHRIHDVFAPEFSSSLFSRSAFEATPAMQVGYTIFGFALGLAVSAVVRRTVPAMGITLVVFIAARFLVVRERPYFMPPLRHLDPIPQPSAEPKLGARNSMTDALGDNPLQVNGGFADAAGNPVSFGGCNRHTVTSGPMSVDEWPRCLRDQGIVNIYTDYQPGSRMGTFHLIEEGIFIGLAAVLFVLAWWRIRRATTTG